MRRATALLRATHLAPSLLVTGLTAALGWQVGLGAQTVAVAAAVAAGQASIGWSNDWLDAGRDAAAGRRDKPVASGEVGAATLRTAALSALTLCVGLSALLGPVPAAVHLAGVAAGWAYNARLKATVASPLPYALAFALVPGVLVVVSLPGTPLPPLWVPAAGALLGVGAHFLNAAPDLEVDRAQAVRGLPQRLGERASVWSGLGLLAAGMAVIVLGPPGPPAPALLLSGALALILLVAALVALARQASRLGFQAAMGVAALAVLGLLSAGTTLP